jgi:VanZ family protein
VPGRTPDTADVMVGLIGTFLGFCLVNFKTLLLCRRCSSAML